MEWMILPLKRYAQFSGRARRKEFWMWVLFLIIASAVLSTIDQALDLSGAGYRLPAARTGGFTAGMQGGSGLLSGIFSLATFLPNLAVQVRRLHDVDRSGWWILLPFVPLVLGVVALLVGALAQPGLLVIGGIFIAAASICAILLLVWFCLDGTLGANRFGADPKGGADLGEVFR